MQINNFAVINNDCLFTLHSAFSSAHFCDCDSLKQRNDAVMAGRYTGKAKGLEYGHEINTVWIGVVSVARLM